MSTLISGIGIASLAAKAVNFVRKFTDYPAEIKKMQKQLPKKSRAAVMKSYKKLPEQTKNQFKQYLREAKLAEAGKLIGYNISNRTPQPAAIAPQKAAPHGVARQQPIQSWVRK